MKQNEVKLALIISATICICVLGVSILMWDYYRREVKVSEMRVMSNIQIINAEGK